MLRTSLWWGFTHGPFFFFFFFVVTAPSVRLLVLKSFGIGCPLLLLFC
jgi:hypothetical protein